MTDKELRRLSRAELLEMLLDQSKEVKRLQKELNEAKRQLASRKIMIKEAGSIAEAALRLNDIFQAADRAAEQYLENVRRIAEEQSQ